LQSQPFSNQLRIAQQILVLNSYHPNSMRIQFGGPRTVVLPRIVVHFPINLDRHTQLLTIEIEDVSDIPVLPPELEALEAAVS